MNCEYMIDMKEGEQIDRTEKNGEKKKLDSYAFFEASEASF